MSKIQMLRIPTNVVRNIDIQLDDKTFVVYAYLLLRKFKEFNPESIELSIKHLKLVTHINDNRTIKMCLNRLYDNGLIESRVEKIPIHSPLQIKLIEKFDNNYFTQLPIDLFKHLNKIKLTGFRIIYYYESYINRRNVNSLFSFPSYEVISNDLNISRTTLSKFNKILQDEKLISITRHKVEIDDFGDNLFERYNNHYQVKINKILELKKED